MSKYLVSFAEDVVKKYADSRIALDEKDVEDLLRCMIKYIKWKVKDPTIYAFNLSNLGTIYKKFDFENPPKNEKTLYDKMLMNYIFKGALSPCNLKPKFDNDNKKELQRHTNNRED